MNGGLRRRLADLVCRLLQAILPSSQQSWGHAIRCETAAIPDDSQALLFALSSLCGLLPRAIASQLLHPFASLTGEPAHDRGSLATRVYAGATRRPRALGIACATAAVALGVLYMMLAGAPVRHLAINVGALGIGLMTLGVLGRVEAGGQQRIGGALVAMAGALLTTTLLGDEVDGAARWLRLGALSIQPSLILVPSMLAGFSRCRDARGTIGILAAVVAIAIQPDRAMAGMMALGLCVLASLRPDRHTVATSLASVAGLAVTLARADTLSAVPYVDQILYSSFDVHAVAGMAVLGGAALLLVPAILGWARDPAHRATYATLGAVWLAAIVAAALGNYPTPLVGFGGSAILGYALSLVALPKLSRAPAATPSSNPTETPPVDHHLRVGLA